MSNRKDIPISTDIKLLFEQMKSVGFPQIILIKYLKEDRCFGVEDSPISPSFLIVKSPPPLLDWHTPFDNGWTKRICPSCFEGSLGHIEDPPTYVNEQTSNTLYLFYGMIVPVGLICRWQIKDILFRIYDPFDLKMTSEGTQKAFLPLPELVGKILSFLDDPRGLIQLALTSKFYYGFVMNCEVWSQYCSYRFSDHLIHSGRPTASPSTNIISCSYRYAAWRYWKHQTLAQPIPQKTELLSNGALWDHLIKRLPQNEPRMAVLRLAMGEGEDTHKKAKYIFILWSPVGSKTLMKMIIAGTKDSVKQMLKGINREYAAVETSDLECLRLTNEDLF